MAASASGPTVVLDNGGCTLKAGFAGKGEPAGCVFGLLCWSRFASRERAATASWIALHSSRRMPVLA